MKKLLIIFVITLSTSIDVSAQKYIVYSMLGKINISTKRGNRPLELREVVTPRTTIVIPYDGELILFDQQNKRRLTITTSGQATIGQFVKDTRNKSVGLTKAVFDTMVKRISSRGETIAQTVDDHITVTRKRPTDSISVRLPDPEPDEEE